MLRRLVLQRVTRYTPSLRPIRCLATAIPPSPNDAFANGTNAYYVEEMYRHWRTDPKSVHVSWDAYFSGMDKGLPSQQAFQPPPTFVPDGAAPALDANQGAKLDDHLKVRTCSLILCVPFSGRLSSFFRYNFLYEHTKSEATTSQTSILLVFLMQTLRMLGPRNLS